MTKPLTRLEEIVAKTTGAERWAIIAAICVAHSHEDEMRKRFGGFAWESLVALYPGEDHD